MVNPFSHLDDYKLMQLYMDGNYMAFEVIYLRHKDRIYTYLNKRLSNKELIEDTFQNIFIKFHKSRHLYNSTHPLIKWLYTISRTVLIDGIKKRNITLISLGDEHKQIEEIDETNIPDLNLQKTLSSKEKKAIELRYYSDKDFIDIAQALNTTEVNSRKLVSRAIKKLKVKLAGEKT